jgi:prolyl-tRNA synthetase
MAYSPNPIDAANNLPTALGQHASAPVLLAVLNDAELWTASARYAAASALVIWLKHRRVIDFNGEISTNPEASVQTWIETYDLLPSTWRGW